jgi:hypothetical protein
MILENPTDYSFIGFRKSLTKNKKYDAILSNKITKKVKYISFGDTRFKQYRDSTGLGLYSKKDTNDKKRRDLYLKRHSGEDKNKYSSGYFSIKYLWN